MSVIAETPFSKSFLGSPTESICLLPIFSIWKINGQPNHRENYINATRSVSESGRCAYHRQAMESSSVFLTKGLGLEMASEMENYIKK
jgi:hypothetical protein